MCEVRKPDQSLHDYYQQQVDGLVLDAYNKIKLKRLAAASAPELEQADCLSLEQKADLRMYCQNFTALVTYLDQLGFLERRMWSSQSAQTILEIISGLNTVRRAQPPEF